MRELSICTVITPAHRRLLEINYDLTLTLNPLAKWKWHVVENEQLYVNPKALRQHAKKKKKATEEQLAELFEQPGTRIERKNVVWAPGYSFAQVKSKILEKYQEKIAPSKLEKLSQKYHGSYAHAFAMARAVTKVDSRFVLLLDPDFFILEKNWIEEILNHMENKRLAVFGAPWNPRWFQKYRYFPCVHCIFLDRDRLDLHPELLVPDLIGAPTHPSGRWMKLANEGKFFQALSRSRDLYREDVRQRSTIGQSRDTGFRLLESFGRLNYESVLPVFEKSKDSFEPRSVTRWQSSLWWERRQTEQYKYLPRPGTFSQRGFSDFGFKDTRVLGWEEFVWKNKPFGFHVRGERHRQEHGKIDYEFLWSILDDFVRPPAARLDTPAGQERQP